MHVWRSLFLLRRRFNLLCYRFTATCAYVNWSFVEFAPLFHPILAVIIFQYYFSAVISPRNLQVSIFIYSKWNRRVVNKQLHLSATDRSLLANNYIEVISKTLKKINPNIIWLKIFHTKSRYVLMVFRILY